MLRLPPLPSRLACGVQVWDEDSCSATSGDNGIFASSQKSLANDLDMDVCKITIRANFYGTGLSRLSTGLRSLNIVMPLLHHTHARTMPSPPLEDSVARLR